MTPSYKTGFYAPRRGGTPRYPQLWRGCVGAWAPCLGNTAYRFNDLSGGNNGGGWNGMSLSNWTTSYGLPSLNFDGVDDFINLAANGNGATTSLLSLFQNYTSPRYSISLWVRTTTSSTDVHAFSCGSNTGDLWMLTLGIGSSVGIPRFFIRDETFTSYFAGNASPINTGRWHHLCLTRNLNTVKVYVDGIGNTNTSFSHSILSFNKISIGSIQRSGTSGYFPGMIDGISLYNRTLSDKEVRLLSTNRTIAYELLNKKTYFLPSAPSSTIFYNVLDPFIFKGTKCRPLN